MSTTPTSSPANPRTDSLRALLSDRSYVFYLLSRIIVTVAMQMQSAAIAWQVYLLMGREGSPMALAVAGLFRFGPNFAISFVGGAVADTIDKRKVLAASGLVPVFVALVLGFTTVSGSADVLHIYLMSALLGAAAAFEGPARQSLLPQVVDRAFFQRAVTVATTTQQLARVSSASLAGLLIAVSGVGAAYLVDAAVFVVSLVLLAGITVRPATGGRAGLSVKAIKEGLLYLKQTPSVFGAMALDMFGVIFASAEALLPIYANDILGAGSQGYGLLISARGVGAFVTSLILTMLPPVKATGKWMVLTVAGYALATVGFGFATWFPLSLLMYGLTGATDQISVVMRQSIIQLGTPDELRGRVSSVNQVFIQASSQIGAIESGVVATAFNSPVIAVVTGGLGCLVALLVIVRLVPQLWQHRTESVHA